jgi:hypothetical protein
MQKGGGDHVGRHVHFRESRGNIDGVNDIGRAGDALVPFVDDRGKNKSLIDEDAVGFGASFFSENIEDSAYVNHILNYMPLTSHWKGVW